MIRREARDLVAMRRSWQQRLEIRNVTTTAGRRDLVIEDGVITSDGAAVENRRQPSAGVSAVEGITVIDGSGFVALPRLVEAHVHLDKTLLGQRWYPHVPAGSIQERIRAERDLLDGDTVEPTAVRAERLLLLLISNGATRVRSHIDISEQTGQRGVEALLELRDRYRNRVDLTFVAFPQQGILASPGTAEQMSIALAAGVETVGGLDPQTFDGDRRAHLSTVFGLAERHGSSIDIHLHEPGAVGVETLRLIAEFTRAHSMQGMVCVSHGFALAQVPHDALEHVADDLAAAGIALITSAPGEGLMPPIDVLLSHGVNVVAASDNIRDSWSPHGSADPLQRAALAAYQLGWSSDAELATALLLVTENAEKALGGTPRTIAPGQPGDVTLLPAARVAEALVSQPAGRLIVRSGQLSTDVDSDTGDPA